MSEISFAEVTAILTQTETEVQEHATALLALAEARQALINAQNVVATAQTNVTVATDAEGSEKADVVAGINAAISKLTEILSTLQT